MPLKKIIKSPYTLYYISLVSFNMIGAIIIHFTYPAYLNFSSGLFFPFITFILVSSFYFILLKTIQFRFKLTLASFLYALLLILIYSNNLESSDFAWDIFTNNFHLGYCIYIRISDMNQKVFMVFYISLQSFITEFILSRR